MIVFLAQVEGIQAMVTKRISFYIIINSRVAPTDKFKIKQQTFSAHFLEAGYH